MQLPNKFLRLNQVVGPNALLPISRSSFYARIASGEFPQPIKIGRSSLWSAEDIDALAARLKNSAATAAGPRRAPHHSKAPK